MKEMKEVVSESELVPKLKMILLNVFSGGGVLQRNLLALLGVEE